MCYLCFYVVNDFMIEEKFPAQNYKQNVLEDCFEDAKKYFLEGYIEVDFAHAIMLAEQKIITDDELKILLKALRALDLDELRKAEYDGTFEDLFYFLQREITKHCDGDVDTAGKLHTARSRNDIDVTIYRVYLRPNLLQPDSRSDEFTHRFS